MIPLSVQANTVGSQHSTTCQSSDWEAKCRIPRRTNWPIHSGDGSLWTVDHSPQRTRGYKRRRRLLLLAQITDCFQDRQCQKKPPAAVGGRKRNRTGFVSDWESLDVCQQQQEPRCDSSYYWWRPETSIICFERAEDLLEALRRYLQRGMKWDYFHGYGITH